MVCEESGKDAASTLALRTRSISHVRIWVQGLGDSLRRLLRTLLEAASRPVDEVAVEARHEGFEVAGMQLFSGQGQFEGR